MSTQEEEVLDEGTEDTTEDISNPLEVSDDDFNELPIPEESANDTTEQVSDEEEELSETEEEEVNEVESEQKVQNAYSDSNDKETPEKLSKATTEDTDTQDTDTSDVDYKGEYQNLLAPFRANGKEMKIASVDDALTLMKMGANYNKKMAGLKPSMRILKMLENNDLLDEQKLSYLIDLDKKNPSAVNKLIKDSGVDPLDIDTEAETDYKPSTYTVNDKEVELDAILEEIRDTESYQSTIDIVGNKWDDASKKNVLDDPKIMRTINEHVSSGLYAEVMGIVDNERMLGKLTDMSDLDAYKHVGNVLQASGAFNKGSAANGKQTTSANRAQDPSLKNRKKAASSTKSAPGKTKSKDFNPLAMSDEEFDKITGSQYM